MGGTANAVHSSVQVGRFVVAFSKTWHLAEDGKDKLRKRRSAAEYAQRHLQRLQPQFFLEAMSRLCQGATGHTTPIDRRHRMLPEFVNTRIGHDRSDRPLNTLSKAVETVAVTNRRLFVGDTASRNVVRHRDSASTPGIRIDGGDANRTPGRNIVVYHQIDRQRIRLTGEMTQCKVFEPDTGMKQRRLVSRHDDRLVVIPTGPSGIAIRAGVLAGTLDRLPSRSTA